MSESKRDNCNLRNCYSLFPVELPVITEHPTDAHINEGKTVTFSVKTKGTNLNYQWWNYRSALKVASHQDDRGGERRKANKHSDWCEATLKEDDHYSGVATPHLSIVNASIIHSGYYYCVISNENGCVTSHQAHLGISKLCAKVQKTIGWYIE